MKRTARDAREDLGFTFAELTVVLALLGIMLAISYTGMSVVYAGRAVSDRNALVAREIGAPLQQMDKAITQNLLLEQATPYSITMIVDRPVYSGSTVTFENIERHVIGATSDGRIVQEIWRTDEFRQSTSLIRRITWSTRNANQSSGVPLFVFRDAAGASLPSASSSDTAGAARSVDVRVVTRYDGRSFEGSRTMFFRNR